MKEDNESQRAVFGLHHNMVIGLQSAYNFTDDEMDDEDVQRRYDAAPAGGSSSSSNSSSEQANLPSTEDQTGD